MTQALVNLGDKPFTTPFTSVGTEICQNLYPEISPEPDTSKTPFYYIKIPGRKRIIEATNTSPCRCIYTTSGGRTFIVNGSQVAEILQDYSVSVVGELVSTAGIVRMRENGYELIVVDGTGGYILELSTNTWSQITDPFFPGVSSGAQLNAPTFAAMLDTYFLVNAPNTNQVYWSMSQYMPQQIDPSLPTNPYYLWSGFQYFNKYGDTDYVVAMIENSTYLAVFGNNSMEYYYDTGDRLQTFSRVPNAFVNIGISAPDTLCRYANNIYWIGSDRTGTVGVFTSDASAAPRRISPRGIEQILNQASTLNGAYAFTYAQAGHAFVVLQVPSIDRCFVYDVVADAWHERTDLDKATGRLHAWKASHATSAWSHIIVGDNKSNAYYVLDTQYYANDDMQGSGINYIKWVKTTPPQYSNGCLVRYMSIQPLFQQGTGLVYDNPEGTGRYPTVQIAASDDSGMTYTNERSAQIGALGAYDTRSRLVMWGSARNRCWRFSGTDPVKIVLVGAVQNAIVGTR